MTARRRTLLTTGLVLSGALALYGTAAGDPIGLTGLFNARGTIEPFHIHDHASHVKLKAEGPGGRRHRRRTARPLGPDRLAHPSRGVDRLRPAGGAPLTMVTQERRRCVTRTYQPGQAFVHPAGPHNFRNDTSATLKFGVAYFVPVGATLLTPATAPKACA